MKDSAKTILCYGDSNTWGAVPGKDNRHPRNTRWTGALQNLLGDEYEVINEGLCGRTFVAVDPLKPHRAGITHLTSILETADPIDTVIIMLGTNDMKTTFNLSAQEIASHLDQTLTLIKSNKVIDPISKIIVICPPAVIIPSSGQLDERMVSALELSLQLPVLYKTVADKHGYIFINSNEYISSSLIDGYHIDAEQHLKIAEVIKDFIT